MKTPIVREVTVNTPQGTRIATVTVYLETIAQNLVHKALRNKQAEARMCWGAITVKLKEPQA